jgi:glutathione synthase/RimK-type ligase-like ATP-grasp enzyme
MAHRDGYVIDDELAEAPLAKLGWHVETVPWDRADVAWKRFEVVVVRSCWDYHRRPEEFLRVLEGIVGAGARLENALELIRWNSAKTYLRDLEALGLAVTPTLWRPRLVTGELAELFAALASPEIVVKPVVGASAEGAFRLDRGSLRARQGEVEEYFGDRAVMVQPLARAVLEEGEHSLFYFDGELSHAVVKTPRPADFRSQEEHGGTVRSSQPDEKLRAAGAATLAALRTVPLYARVDMVRANDGAGFWLMELEVIEPSLYLRMDPAAPGRFAEALDSRMRRLGTTVR